jgi:hypothetical protein
LNTVHSDPEYFLNLSNGAPNFRPKRKGIRSFAPSTDASRSDAIAPTQISEEMTWPCTLTFCGKYLKSRYEWKRHEVTHLPGTWICMPDDTPSYSDKCVLCGAHDPRISHFRTHFDLEACVNKSHQERAFVRKDKLKDHIRRVHLKQDSSGRDSSLSPLNTPRPSSLDCWRREPDLVVMMPQALWCGFCKTSLVGWKERQSHVGKHLQEGALLTSWEFLM